MRICADDALLCEYRVCSGGRLADVNGMRDSAVAAALSTEADDAEILVRMFENALNAVKNKTPAGDGGVDYSIRLTKEMD